MDVELNKKKKIPSTLSYTLTDICFKISLKTQNLHSDFETLNMHFN